MGVRARLGAAPRAARNWGFVCPLLPAWPGAPAVTFLAFLPRPTGGIAGEWPSKSPCGVSQCTVPRSTVPFPMTPPYVGRGVIFFLLKLFFTHDSRTLPGFAPPGVSTTLLFGDQPAVCDVRLRTGHAPATFRSIKAFIQLLLQSELSHLHPSSCVCSNRCSALVTQRFLNRPGILSSTTSLHNASRCGHSSNTRGHS